MKAAVGALLILLSVGLTLMTTVTLEIIHFYFGPNRTGLLDYSLISILALLGFYLLFGGPKLTKSMHRIYIILCLVASSAALVAFVFGL